MGVMGRKQTVILAERERERETERERERERVQATSQCHRIPSYNIFIPVPCVGQSECYLRTAYIFITIPYNNDFVV